MRLLLDEMLAPAIARELRARGHDVISIAERREWQAYRDQRVMELARAERRGIVTNNVRDFRPLAAQAVLSGAGHFGMLFMASDYRRTKSDVGRIVAALEAKLARYAGERDLLNAEEWL